MKRTAGLLVLTLAVGIAAAWSGWVGMAGAQDATTVVKANEEPWKDHPVFPGASIAILVGDPTKAGVIVQRIKFPPNYRVAPHTHPYAEVVTVLSSTLGSGMGDTFEAKGELLKRGSLRAPRQPSPLCVDHD